MYTYTGLDAEGKRYTYTRFFTPVQFRRITCVPFPACATRTNCDYLISAWNHDYAGRGTYYIEV
jgi:hypothetical protein